MKEREKSWERHEDARRSRNAQSGFFALTGLNAVIALAAWLKSSQGDYSQGDYMLLAFPVVSLFWNLPLTLLAFLLGRRGLAKGFLLATGLVILVSFALCASLGFAA